MRVFTDRASIIVAFLVLWLGTTVALGAYGVKINTNAKKIGRNELLVQRQADALQSQAETLHVSQLRACHRLNIIRAEDNRSQLKDFKLFSLTGRLVAAAVSRKATARLVAVTRGYLAKISEDVLSKEWTPLTACRLAVDEPGTYPAPDPIPFSVKLPTSKALVVGPGE